MPTTLLIIAIAMVGAIVGFIIGLHANPGRFTRQTRDPAAKHQYDEAHDDELSCIGRRGLVTRTILPSNGGRVELNVLGGPPLAFRAYSDDSSEILAGATVVVVANKSGSVIVKLPLDARVHVSQMVNT